MAYCAAVHKFGNAPPRHASPTLRNRRCHDCVGASRRSAEEEPRESRGRAEETLLQGTRGGDASPALARTDEAEVLPRFSRKVFAKAAAAQRHSTLKPLGMRRGAFASANTLQRRHTGAETHGETIGELQQRGCAIRAHRAGVRDNQRQVRSSRGARFGPARVSVRWSCFVSDFWNA